MSGLYDEDGIDGPFERGMAKPIQKTCGCGFRGTPLEYDLHDCVRMTALAESRAERRERGKMEDCEECGEPTRETVSALIGLRKRAGRVAICRPCQEEHEHEASGEIHCEGCGEWISDDGAKFCPPCGAEENVAAAEVAHDLANNR